MDQNVALMLKQICPDCGSKAGDIIAYIPEVTNGRSIEIEIECENCGAKGFLRGNLIETEFDGSMRLNARSRLSRLLGED